MAVGTVGTVGSIAAVIAAPFTGGLSLFAIGAVVATGVVSAVTSSSGDIYDAVKTR